MCLKEVFGDAVESDTIVRIVVSILRFVYLVTWLVSM